MNWHLSLILLLSFQLIGCGERSVLQQQTAADRFTENGTPILGSWSNSSFPLNIQISDDFTNEEIDAIDVISTQWINSTDGQIEFFRLHDEGASNKSAQTEIKSFKNDGVLGIYKRFNWFESINENSLAVTQYTGKLQANGILNITHADIFINYANYNFDVFNPREIRSNTGEVYDLPSVILHELGHFIGLDHNVTGVMRATLPQRRIRREVLDEDRAGILDLYSLSPIEAGPGSDEGADVQFFQANNEFEEVEVSGIVELRADGKCHHSLNGEFHYAH